MRRTIFLFLCVAMLASLPENEQVDGIRLTNASIIDDLLRDSQVAGWYLLQMHKTLWSPDFQGDRDALREHILFSTGIGMSYALRAYFLIGDRSFYYTPQCRQELWLKENIHTGVLAEDPAPFFPPDLLDITDSHYLSFSPPFDPYSSPYTTMEERLKTISAFNPGEKMEFSSGTVVYFPLGERMLKEKKRPTGFVLLVFGASPSSSLKASFNDESVHKVLKLMGWNTLPDGVIYADAVSPEDVENLYRAPVLPSDIYRALGFETDMLWDLSPIIYLPPDRLSATYYSLATKVRVTLTPLEPLLRSKGKPVILVYSNNFGLDMRKPSSHISIKISSDSYTGDALVDWGDSTTTPIRLGKDEVEIRHSYEFLSVEGLGGYFMTIVSVPDGRLLARFKLGYYYSFDKEPAFRSHPHLIPPPVDSEAVQKVLTRIYEVNVISGRKNDFRNTLLGLLSYEGVPEL
jgi:hypothetical protein